MIVNQKNEIVYSMDARVLDMGAKEAGKNQTAEKQAVGKQAAGKMVEKAERKAENKTEQETANKIEEKTENKAKQETANKANSKTTRGKEAVQKEIKETFSGDEQSLGATPALTKRQRTVLEKELERTGVALDAVLNRYHLESAEQINEEIYKKAIECLRKSKSREAA